MAPAMTIRTQGCVRDLGKNKKPSRNGVTAFFDSWITAAY